LREISSSAYDSLKIRLEQLEEEAKELGIELERAVGFGDISENTEYDTAKAALAINTQERGELEQLLRTAKVKHGYSNTISAGTLISVKVLKENDEVEEDLGLLMFDEFGDMLFAGRINKDSALGTAIEGGTSGTYTIQDIKGHPIKYEVIVEPESRLPEFLQMYSSDRKAMISRMFAQRGIMHD
jgi:transcription elongation factor GreA